MFILSTLTPMGFGKTTETSEEDTFVMNFNSYHISEIYDTKRSKSYGGTFLRVTGAMNNHM